MNVARCRWSLLPALLLAVTGCKFDFNLNVNDNRVPPDGGPGDDCVFDGCLGCIEGERYRSYGGQLPLCDAVSERALVDSGYTCERTAAGICGLVPPAEPTCAVTYTCSGEPQCTEVGGPNLGDEPLPAAEWDAGPNWPPAEEGFDAGFGCALGYDSASDCANWNGSCERQPTGECGFTIEDPIAYDAGLNGGGGGGGNGSCAGACGGSAGSCYCDSVCTSAGDCCADFEAECPHIEPEGPDAGPWDGEDGGPGDVDSGYVTCPGEPDAGAAY